MKITKEVYTNIKNALSEIEFDFNTNETYKQRVILCNKLFKDNYESLNNFIITKLCINNLKYIFKYENSILNYVLQLEDIEKENKENE